MKQIKKLLPTTIIFIILTNYSIYAMSDDYNYYKEKEYKTNIIDNSYVETNSQNPQNSNSTNSTNSTNQTDRSNEAKENNINLAIVTVEAIIKVDWLGDKSASNRSIIEAQKMAIGTAVEHILSSGVIVNNFESQKNKLLKNYQSYIKEYTIITNEKTDDTFKTQMDVLVDYASIKKYMLSEGVLNDENIKSSITIAILDDNKNINNIFNTELKEILKNNNFYILTNNDSLNNIINTNNINADNILNTKELNSLSSFILKEHRSKYAIIGNVNAYFLTQIEGTSLYTYKSSVYLDVIDIVNMKSITNVIYQTSGTSASMDGAYSFVLKKAAKYASDEIIKSINKDMELNKEPREYMLVIGEINYEDSLTLQREIKNNIEQVKNVYNYGEFNNKQTLVVSFVGDIKTLAIELNVKARNIGFRIIIDNYDDTTIFLSAKKR